MIRLAKSLWDDELDGAHLFFINNSRHDWKRLMPESDGAGKSKKCWPIKSSAVAAASLRFVVGAMRRWCGARLLGASALREVLLVTT